jgi:hypothetical protein
MSDITVKGWVLRDTPNKTAVVFLWEHRNQAYDTVLLPKKLITVAKTDPFVDEVTMPEWLAKDRMLIRLEADHPERTPLEPAHPQ